LPGFLDVRGVCKFSDGDQSTGRGGGFAKNNDFKLLFNIFNGLARRWKTIQPG
jgi:hypothetical protein